MHCLSTGNHSPARAAIGRAEHTPVLGCNQPACTVVQKEDPLTPAGTGYWLREAPRYTVVEALANGGVAFGWAVVVGVEGYEQMSCEIRVDSYPVNIRRGSVRRKHRRPVNSAIGRLKESLSATIPIGRVYVAIGRVHRQGIDTAVECAA